ncbi:MAG: hypothetical protein AB9903_21505 [Vulcanimicrobiota bacterium]
MIQQRFDTRFCTTHMDVYNPELNRQNTRQKANEAWKREYRQDKGRKAV